MTKVPEHFPRYITPEEPQDRDYSVCDGCAGHFAEDELTLHEDGNNYCDECNYPTQQDLADGYADECQHSEGDR